MKTIYYATHKNIKGNEQVRVEQNIDLLDTISYQVILEGNYTPDDKYKQVIGLYDNVNDAVRFADNYKTI